MGSQTAWLTRVCWPKQHVYLNTYIISNSTQNYLQFAEVWQKLQKLSLSLEKTKNDSGNNNTKNINHSADHLPQLQTQFGSCKTFSGENFWLQNLLFQHTVMSVTRGNVSELGANCSSVYSRVQFMAILDFQHCHHLPITLLICACPKSSQIGRASVERALEKWMWGPRV